MMILVNLNIASLMLSHALIIGRFLSSGNMARPMANSTEKMTFKEQIQQGIPNNLPNIKPYETEINHAPKRKEILSEAEIKLALTKLYDVFHSIVELCSTVK